MKYFWTRPWQNGPECRYLLNHTSTLDITAISKKQTQSSLEYSPIKMKPWNISFHFLPQAETGVPEKKEEWNILSKPRKLQSSLFCWRTNSLRLQLASLKWRTNDLLFTINHMPTMENLPTRIFQMFFSKPDNGKQKI